MGKGTPKSSFLPSPASRATFSTGGTTGRVTEESQNYFSRAGGRGCHWSQEGKPLWALGVKSSSLHEVIQGPAQCTYTKSAKESLSSTFPAMSGAQSDAMLYGERDGDEKNLLQESVEDFDSQSLDGRMDSNDEFAQSKSEFSFGGSRTGQDPFHNSKGSVSFNNSITEGDFGAFACDPVDNKASFSESGEFVMNDFVPSAKESQAMPQASNDSFGMVNSAPIQHTPQHEPTRPPSRHQSQEIEYYPNRDNRLGRVENSSFQVDGNHGHFQNAPISYAQPTGSHMFHQEPEQAVGMGAFEQRNIADVSVDDVRQRQMQLSSIQGQGTGYDQSQLYSPKQNTEFQIHTPHMLSASQRSPHDFNPHAVGPQATPFQNMSMVGLSNTVHGNSYQRHDTPQGAMNNTQGFPQNIPDPFYGPLSSASPSIPSLQGNVSIAAERQQSPKALFCTFDGNSSSHSLSNPSKTVSDAMSEAMEKLSDSMRRTAMSRSIVKQFSGKAHLNKQSSMRLMANQRSGRALLNQASDKNLMSEHSSHSHRTTVRRSSSMVKHQIQHPSRSRSVRQLDSQQNLNQSFHNITLNIDGRNLGDL